MKTIVRTITIALLLAAFVLATIIQALPEFIVITMLVKAILQA